MNLQDKGGELVESEEQIMDEHVRQWQKLVQRDEAELAHLDQSIRRAEEAEREMNKPITN